MTGILATDMDHFALHTCVPVRVCLQELLNKMATAKPTDDVTECLIGSDLPKNFLVASFLQARESTSIESKTSPCEACGGGEESEGTIENVASVYCVECQLKLCQNCERGHKVIKPTRFHNLIGIGEKISVEALQQTASLSYCDQQEEQLLKIYCSECKLAMCTMCYIKSHNDHKWSYVNDVVGDFRKCMTNDIDHAAAGMDRCRDMLKHLENEKDFIWQVEKTGVEISMKAEQMKQTIDDHREKLMIYLSLVKQKRMKEIESLREEIERQLTSIESYQKNVDEVRQKGTACDIARAASGLHDKANELMTFQDVIERTLAELGHADVTFTSSNFVIDDVNQTLGHLSLNLFNSGKTTGSALTDSCQ